MTILFVRRGAYYNLSDDEILETRNYNNEYGIECTSNYIDDLTERNSDGKYEEILKDLKKNDDYYFINRFNSNASLDLLYNEASLWDPPHLLLRLFRLW